MECITTRKGRIRVRARGGNKCGFVDDGQFGLTQNMGSLGLDIL